LRQPASPISLAKCRFLPRHTRRPWLSGTVELIHADVGANLFDIGRNYRGFWILLSGELRVHKPIAGGDQVLIHVLAAGELFGEVSLLMGKDSTDVVITVLKPSSSSI